MNKNKSIAAYTNKWLSQNKNLYYIDYPEWINVSKKMEKDMIECNIIILKTNCAPKEVVKRIHQINFARGLKAYEIFLKTDFYSYIVHIKNRRTILTLLTKCIDALAKSNLARTKLENKVKAIKYKQKRI